MRALTLGKEECREEFDYPLGHGSVLGHGSLLGPVCAAGRNNKVHAWREAWRHGGMEGADLPVAKSLPARRARTVRRPMSACLVASTPATMGSTVLKEGEDMFLAESDGRWDLKFELRVEK